MQQAIHEDDLFQQVQKQQQQQQQQRQQVMTPEEKPTNLLDNIPVISQEEEEEEEETFEAPQVRPYNLRVRSWHLMNAIVLDEYLVPQHTIPHSKLQCWWELANQVLHD